MHSCIDCVYPGSVVCACIHRYMWSPDIELYNIAYLTIDIHSSTLAYFLSAYLLYLCPCLSLCLALCCHLILAIYHIVCLCSLSMGPPRIPAYIISHPHARRVYDIHSLFFPLTELLLSGLLNCRRSGSIPLPSVVVASYSEDLQSKEYILQRLRFLFLSFSYPFIPPVLLHALLL